MGEDTVNVVLLKQEQNGLVALGGGIRVRLERPAAPTGDLLEELFDASVCLSTADGLDDGALDAIRDVPVPPAFRASPWLRRSRPVVLTDGTALIGRHYFHYSPTVGLWLAGGLDGSHAQRSLT